MDRIWMPGDDPSGFDLRLGFVGKDRGDVGQYVNAKHSLLFSGSDLFSDRFGWPVDDMGVPNLDWSGGAVPFIGPTLTLTGTPGTNIPTPWAYRNGSPIQCTAFGNGEHYIYNAGAFDPAANYGVTVLAMTRILNRLSTTNSIIATRGNTSGWMLYSINNGHTYFISQDPGGASVNSYAGIITGWCLLGVTSWFLGGNYTQRVYINGEFAIQGVSAAVASISSGLGVGISSDTIGATRSTISDISRVLVWYHPTPQNIANDAWHQRVSHYALGTYEIQNQQSDPDFVRATSGTKSHGTTYFLLGREAARTCCQDGILIEKTSVNKVYNNHDPANATGWIGTGGVVPTAVNDAVALAAAGLRESGPNAIQFANASGATQILYCGAQTSNTNPHSVSVFGRMTAGSGARLGLRDASSGAFQDLGAMTDNYVRTMAHGITPNDTDQVFAIQVPNNCTVIVEWGQLEEQPRCTSPIINIATAATAQRNFDDFVTDEDPEDRSGSIEFKITPVDWSGNEDPGSILFLSGSGNPAVWVETGTWRARIDGTTNLDSGVAPVDGVEHKIRLRWNQNGNQSIEVWNGTTLLARVESAYDGTLYSAGTWEFVAGPSSYIRDVVTYRNGSG